MKPILFTPLFFSGAVLFCLIPWATGAGLALGTGLALPHENPFSALAKRVAAVILQACLVRVGFGAKQRQGGSEGHADLLS